MKPIKTLDELKKELMSEHGAIKGTQRFRINEMHLENFRENYWTSGVGVFNHGFLLDLENWYYYEKPKKIVKESFEGFVSERDFQEFKEDIGAYHLRFFERRRSENCFRDSVKAKLIIEREVDE